MKKFQLRFYVFNQLSEFTGCGLWQFGIVAPRPGSSHLPKTPGLSDLVSLAFCCNSLDLVAFLVSGYRDK